MTYRVILIRKCLVVSVIFIVTCVSLHFKGQSKDNYSYGNEKSLELDNHYINRKLHEHQSNTHSKNEATKIQNENKSRNDTSYKEEQTHSRQKLNSKISKSPMTTKTPVIIPLLKSNMTNVCTNPAYNEFPSDVFSQSSRTKGAIIVHLIVVLYMFYCLAVVCDLYFLPSLEECAVRLNLSEDVAGATFMAAGSSAPELFTAILGVFIAKGDVGTGTIVGSAVFNILFVIGLCALYTVSTELNWWPVARDSSYYTFTVLILIVFIYDGKVTTFESFTLLVLYGVYITIMSYNIKIRNYVVEQWSHYGRHSLDELENLKANPGAVHYRSFKAPKDDMGCGKNYIQSQPQTTLFEATNLVIIQHKKLFRPTLRFQAAARLIITQRKKSKIQRQNYQQQEEFNFAKSFDSVRRASILPDQEFWRTIPDPKIDGWLKSLKWAVIAPIHASLYYTIPDCKAKSHLFLVTFFMSIVWTAFFSYIMVWMVTLIGYTLGIPDSIMGITFLAAGTSVPDAYASLHVAKQGQADMAVSNSIGSNVFDILVGLALPWFVETAIVDSGSVAYINSRGLIYAIILLFLSLLITLFLFHRHHWTLNPQLGYALILTYVIFLVISSALEFNLLGYVNPPMCGE